MRHATTAWPRRAPERLGAMRAHAELCHGTVVEDSTVTQWQSRLHREVHGDTAHPLGKERWATGHRSGAMIGRWISPVRGGIPVKEGSAMVVPVTLLRTRLG
jgi:hypothetical protein